MVYRCCVEKCWHIKRPKISFHRFPLGDPERLREWLLALNVDVNTPRHMLSKMFVCQKHFEPHDYQDSPEHAPLRRARHLKTTAVPIRIRHGGVSGDPTAGVIKVGQVVSMVSV
ncbi:THAP domain-containing protein 3-like [Centropristis striata]|uniref:THAP domain-containing protein 3-like n=1 Tax=Centropristis striata TaxID=184440 RepID=UPI0027E1AC70|nr:THAP domain-containing protein 3-like [Centropristis striata]